MTKNYVFLTHNLFLQNREYVKANYTLSFFRDLEISFSYANQNNIFISNVIQFFIFLECTSYRETKKKYFSY